MGGRAYCSVSIYFTIPVFTLDSCEEKPFLAGKPGSDDLDHAPGRQFLDGDAHLFSASVFIPMAGPGAPLGNRWLMDGGLRLVHSTGHFFHT